MIVDPVVIDRRVYAAGRAEVDLVVPPDLHYFRGHFPGTPIVPGVVQVKWAIAFACELSRARGGFRGSKTLKFLEIMQPGTEATLKLDFAEASGELRFVFESERVRYSSGKLLLRRAP